MRADQAMSVGQGQDGFTLIELMMVVAIIGILSAIAYPNYMQYLTRSNRVGAQAAILENVQFMERYFTTHGAYSGLPDPVPAPTLPRSQSPDSGSAKYSIQLPAGALTATTYLIQAVPAFGYTDPVCGTMTIDQTGTRTESGTGTLAECWKN